MASWSQFQSLEYSCYDVGHTWTPSCTTAAASICIDCFMYSTKIYTTVYVLSLLIRCKRITREVVKKMLLDILQSSCFLTWNGFTFVAFICIFRWLFGRFYIANAGFMPGFMSSVTAILLERKSRRRLLAVYVFNVVLDALYRMAVYRRYFKPIPNGEVYLFSIAVAGFLYMYRKRENMHDFTGKILSFLLGKEEGGYSPVHAPSEWDASTHGNVLTTKDQAHHLQSKDYFLNVKKHWKNLKLLTQLGLNYLKAGPRHALCVHQNSCHYYWIHAFVRPFLLGYGGQTALALLSSFPKILKKPSSLKSQFLKARSIKFGAFLGSFCAIFKIVNCVLRWLRDNDDVRHGLVAGFIAGLTMIICPMPSVALYTFSKLLEVLYLKGIKAGYCPDLPGGTELFYALVTGFMFHVAVLEPHNLRPSYWKFLIKLTAGKLAGINRFVLHPFGTDSALMFAEKVYKYDHRYTSTLLKETMKIGMTAS